MRLRLTYLLTESVIKVIEKNLEPAK